MRRVPLSDSDVTVPNVVLGLMRIQDKTDEEIRTLVGTALDNGIDFFDHADVFDITRDPNPHLGFGGGGPHYCLGKSLAVLEIDLIFGALADAMPGLRLVEDPRRLRSSWINGIKELRVAAD